MVTGFPIFYSVGLEKMLIRKMIELLGPLRQHWYKLVDPEPYAEEDGNTRFVFRGRNEKAHLYHFIGVSLYAAAEIRWRAKFDAGSALSPLVRSMLQYDPAIRPTADEVATHPWFDDVRSGC
jgi:serine/threonine protein kinase